MLINSLGTAALICLLLWVLVGGAFSLLYPSVRTWIVSRHPAHSVNLILAFWLTPPAFGVLVTLLLFVPHPEGILVSVHCHGSCEQHAPLVYEASLAWLALMTLSAVVMGLLLLFSRELVYGARMQRRFTQLSQEHAGYQLLPTDEPAVFTLGWLKPKVFVSEGLRRSCSRAQLDIILLHESSHRRRRDSFWLLLLRVLTLMLPALRRRQVIADAHLMAEQACDRVAARKYGAVHVADTLVHVSRLLRRSGGNLWQLGFDGSDLSARVHALLAEESRPRLTVWQSSGIWLVSLALVVLALNPAHHGVEWIIQVLGAAHVH